MNTEALIAALAADAPADPAQDRSLAFGLAGAFVVTAIAFAALIFPRPDFWAAADTVRFLFKFAAMAALAATAYLTLRQAMRPEMGAKPFSALLLVAPAMLAIAVVMEMLIVPSERWAALWIGHNSKACLTIIPSLSLLPLAILLTILSRGASTAPRRTGALAGLLAGGIGGFFYAAHCTDDSPFFVVTWYPIAIGAVTVLGALIGPRALRW